MAKHYNPEVYTAKLWPHHYRFMANGGKVLALKTEKASQDELKGELQLFAIIAPNDWLIEANRQGQYVHTSIEVTEDFMGKGHFYLAGLGVTDDPASVGTHELKFKSQVKEPSHVFSGHQINTCLSLEPESGLIKRLFESFQHTETEEPEMTPEQLEALTTALKNDQAETLKNFKFEILAELKPDQGEDTETPEEAQATNFEIMAEELKAQFKTLSDKFDAMSKEESSNTTTVPEGTGTEDTQEYI